MTAPPIPIVWAKLRPPMPPAAAVARPRLIDTMTAPNAALTAIVAPAGYGKTTAAVQLVSSMDAAVAWLSLEPADATPARFWTYVAAALQRAGVAAADTAYQTLTDEGVEATALTLRAEIDRFDGAVVLVLDDAHAIENSEVTSQLAKWLRHPIDNFRLVCTSRTNLPLPVGRLRSQGLLTEARSDQLAFSPGESAELLRTTFGLGALSTGQLETLDQRTRGWPVGVYLAGLTLQDDPDVDRQLERFAGDTRHLSEYLADEAMDGVSEDVRAFVLATSVVNVLNPDLCDALTGMPGSLRTLRELVAANVFTSALDSARTLFQYHPLFREHLLSALRSEHPEEVTELHARASEWYESNGDVDEAVYHATLSGDLERSQSLIVATSLQFANVGHFETVIKWVEALGDPAELRTEVCLIMCWVMLNVRRYDDLDRWMEHAESASGSEVERSITAMHLPTIRGHWARHRGDVGAMLTFGDKALAAESNAPDRVEAERLFLRADAGRGAALSLMGSALLWAGDHDPSAESLRNALSVAAASGVVIEQVFCYCHLSFLEAERGDMDAAEAHADQALAMVPPANERQLQPALAYVARSMVHLARGRPSDAAEDLAQARRLVKTRSEPLTVAAIQLQEARILHRTGDSEAARAAVRTARTTVEGLPDPRFDQRLRSAEAHIRFVPRDAPDLPPGARELTDREQAVLALLPHGLARRELADQLHVSENTVKTHLTSIRHKLGVSGRESIVDRARQLGLLADGA